MPPCGRCVHTSGRGLGVRAILRTRPVVEFQRLVALPREVQPLGVLIVGRIPRAVALLLGHPFPPLEDGVAEGLLASGERWHGEAAIADRPVLG